MPLWAGLPSAFILSSGQQMALSLLPPIPILDNVIALSAIYRQEAKPTENKKRIPIGNLQIWKIGNAQILYKSCNLELIYGCTIWIIEDYFNK